MTKKLSLVFWLGLIFSFLYAYTLKFDYDSIQMIEKGRYVVEDNTLLPIGNAASAGMGHLPGYMSNLVVGLPLFLWNSPYAALGFLIVLHLLSFFFLKNTFKDSFGEYSLCLFMILFWLSPWRAGETYLWNPSYLFFATALHWWSALKMKDNASPMFTVLHLFSLYFAFQLHNSCLILFMATAFLFFRRLIKVHWKAAIVFAVAGAMTFIPYFQYIADNPQYAQKIREPDAFIGKGFLYLYPMLKGLAYWIRFSSTLFPRHLFKEVHLEWLDPSWLKTAIHYELLLVKNLMAGLSLLLALYLNFKFFRKKFSLIKKVFVKETQTAQEFNDQYALTLFISAVIAIGLSPIVLIHWHLLIVFPITLYTFVRGFELVEHKKTYRDALATILIIYFTYYNFMASMGSEKHEFGSNPHHQYRTGDYVVE